MYSQVWTGELSNCLVYQSPKNKAVQSLKEFNSNNLLFNYICYVDKDPINCPLNTM